MERGERHPGARSKRGTRVGRGDLGVVGGDGGGGVGRAGSS